MTYYDSMTTRQLKPVCTSLIGNRNVVQVHIEELFVSTGSLGNIYDVMPVRDARYKADN
jgi:uncharacterized protein (DUF2235 family)